MASKQIRVSDSLYARVKDEKRGDETMGEALERMVGGYGLMDFVEDSRGKESLDVDAIEESMEEGSKRNMAEVRNDLTLE